MTPGERKLLLIGVPAAIIVGLVLKAALGAKEAPTVPKSKGKIRPGKPDAYLPAVRKAVARHPEFAGRWSLLAGLIEQESRWDPNAESPTGAIGLGQFTRTGREEVRRLMTIPKFRGRYTPAERVTPILKGLVRANMSDPEVSIEAAALLLAGLLDRWGGHVEAALTDYNAGGKPAGIVKRAGSHAAALAALKALPANERSQSPEYAPGVLSRVNRYA